MTPFSSSVFGRTFGAIVLLMLAAARVQASGALAIDPKDHKRYALVKGQESPDAAALLARQRCGASCNVVHRYDSGCAAIAATPRAYGWGIGSTAAEAGEQALNKCRDYGGSACKVQATSCEAAVATPEATLADISTQDTIGVRIGMGPAEVHEVLRAAGFAPKEWQSFPQYANPMTGMLVSDTANPSVAQIKGRVAPNTSGQPEEQISVLFTPEPGQERAFSIYREVGYTASGTPGIPLREFRYALTAKYGKPLLDGRTESGLFVMFWSTARGVESMKPWMRESDFGGTALQCADQARTGGGITIESMRMSPLALGTGHSPAAVAQHCGTAFVVVRMYLNDAASQSPATAIVTKYGLSLYDSAAARQGQSKLMSAQAAAAQKAQAEQRDKAAQAKPRL